MPANKPKPTYSIAAQSASDAEGDSGTTPLTFTVTRSSGNGTATIDYAVTGAQADDFAGGALPSGTVTFAKGQKVSEPVTISVAGDTLVELDESFTVTLSNPSRGKIGIGTAQGTILNDDSNNAPTGLSDDLTGSVNENVAAGAIIIDLNATDVDGDTVSYYFKDATGAHVLTDGYFNIDADTGMVTTARAFDFENDGASLSFTAFAGDGNGGEDSGTYTVPVGNVVAEAQVVDFEDTPYAPIPDGYAGFNWDSNNSPYFADDSDTDVYGGHSKSLFVISPNNELAWNGYAGKNTVIARADGSNFNLISMDFISSIPTTGADQLRISSYDDGVYQQETFININRNTFTTLELNWDDIDTLYIDVITGEYQGAGFWGMDNLVITQQIDVA